MTSLVVLDLLTRHWICLARLGISDQSVVLDLFD